MKKTASQIESDLYKYFKDKINPLINGQTYRNGVRPLNSQKEDPYWVRWAIPNGGN